MYPIPPVWPCSVFPTFSPEQAGTCRGSGGAVAWHGRVAVATLDLARQLVAAIDRVGDEAGRFGVADQIDAANAGGLPVGAAHLQRIVERAFRPARGHRNECVDGNPLA